MYILIFMYLVSMFGILFVSHPRVSRNDINFVKYATRDGGCLVRIMTGASFDFVAVFWSQMRMGELNG